MKKTGICPKCGGRDILYAAGEAGAYGAGNNIPTGVTNFSRVPVDRYICASCGYAEEWVDREGLDKLKKKRNRSKRSDIYSRTDEDERHEG